MAAPYNGGDAHYSANNYVGGSGDISNITGAEISVIVVTILGVIVALIVVFWCRIVKARKEEGMIGLEDGPGGGGGDIELEEKKKKKNGGSRKESEIKKGKDDDGDDGSVGLPAQAYFV
ncbi:hypothetical protein QBC38DRAFT_95006 [Podospora fimiseda]|uniref:Uncharacterized protein n=1 Tax=Podospora fimiseda TaxID=252190 RepID=A0AAN7H8V4_9PEZI|nr:hypothetical protein QBC38DRAFT_95006 [Podospora fimiseda]